MDTTMKQNDKIYESPALTSDFVNVDAGFCVSSQSQNLTGSTIGRYTYTTDENW